jgi:hypothetical protein
VPHACAPPSLAGPWPADWTGVVLPLNPYNYGSTLFYVGGSFIAGVLGVSPITAFSVL